MLYLNFPPIIITALLIMLGLRVSKINSHLQNGVAYIVAVTIFWAYTYCLPEKIRLGVNRIEVGADHATPTFSKMDPSAIRSFHS